MNKRITVNYSRTINTGNYNSQKLMMGLDRDLEPSENISTALKDQFVILKKLVDKTLTKNLYFEEEEEE